MTDLSRMSLELATTPAGILDLLRSHPEWSERERDAVLDRLVERFPADDLVDVVQTRLHDLGGADAEVLLRLVEAHPRPALLQALSFAVVAQPDLSPERAWDALAVLDGAGVIAGNPVLAERWDELNEVFDDDGSIEQLAEQIEDDPDGLWLALQGLTAVEPEVRSEIVAGLTRGPLGPGLIGFLRLLVYSEDKTIRSHALAALADGPTKETPAVLDAWSDLARNHPDKTVVEMALQRVDGTTLAPRPASIVVAPRLGRSLVTAIDGRGGASIVLSAVRGRQYVTAAFRCDIESGVTEVYGDVSTASPRALATFDEFSDRPGLAVVEGSHPLALGLLAGCLTLCGPETPPALRYWVEATAGPGLRPQPFRAEFPGWEPDEVPFDEMPERAREVLGACPDWLDDSPLTYELAEEIRLREGDGPSDPRRDAGAYRFLFEHRLRGQLERYRRLLLWMAWFWKAAGDERLSRSAMALAWQLSDAQHVVPGHPFTVALTTRSLNAAQNGLSRGIDPRRAASR